MEFILLMILALPMSLRRDIGCRFCGHVNETALLDPAYTEYHSFLEYVVVGIVGLIISL